MAKNKKKRNKIYTGADAAIAKPVITKIEAVNRSKIGQFWFERKKLLKPIIKTVLIVAGVIILIIEIVRLFNGGF